MHRNRTWQIDPTELRTQRNRILPIEGGDGSTLNLDFTTGILDPRLTFSRASTATFVNSSGYVEYAGANLVLYSQQITTTNWSTGNATTLAPNTTEVLDPQGGNTATKISLGANAYNSRAQAIALPGSQTYTFSFWIRGTAGITCRIYSFAGYVGDLVTETVYSYSTSEWTRVSTTFTTNAATTNVLVYVCSKNTAPASTDVIYVWGAQLNPGTTAQTYYPTTTAAFYSTPRFDYSPTNIGEPRGLLIEGQAANALYYSEDITNGAWTVQAFPNSYPTVSITGGIAPNNTNTANLLTEGTGSWSRSIYQFNSAAAGTYTYSVWVKAISGNTRFVRLVLSSGSGDFVYVTVNISTGAVTQTAAAVGTASAASATVTSYPGSWYRIALTGTLSATRSFVFIVPSDTATPAVSTSDYGRLAYTGTGAQFAVWGAQLELGSGASSYIPTGASQVTRNADICYADNISSWYTQGIGTMLFVGRPNQSLARNYVGFSTGLNDPRILLYGTNATEVILYLQNSAGSNLVFPSGSLTLGSVNRMAATFEQSNYSCVVNGGTVGTSTTASPAMPSGINRINIGMRNDQFNQFCGHVMQVKYYSTRLTNAQLQALTAP